MVSKLLFFCLLVPGLSIAQQKKHVLLVSIDGFRPDFYKRPEWDAPTLKRLKAAGTYANGVRSVLPSVTYPSHTSIITGELPGRHGIYYNAPYGSKNGAWYWEEKAIKVATLWDAVKTSGLKSGAVMWPVTVDAPIDYNFPVRRADNGQKADQLSVTRPFVTPAGLLDQIESSVGPLSPADFNHGHLDLTIGKMASFIVTAYQPDLMAVHFIGLDHAQHGIGRSGVEVQQALHLVDSMLAVILRAYETAGIIDQTDIIITGDHGFVSVERQLAPNTLLYKGGLITDADWKARFHSTGGSSFLYLKDPKDRQSLAKVIELLKAVPVKERKYFRIIQRDELDKMGVNPEVALALAADNASALNNSEAGSFVRTKKKLTGSHGHDPRMQELFTGFIGSGPSFQNGAVVQQMSLTDMSALISDILGLSFKTTDPDLKNSLFKK